MEIAGHLFTSNPKKLIWVVSKKREVPLLSPFKNYPETLCSCCPQHNVVRNVICDFSVFCQPPAIKFSLWCGEFVHSIFRWLNWKMSWIRWWMSEVEIEFLAWLFVKSKNIIKLQKILSILNTWVTTMLGLVSFIFITMSYVMPPKCNVICDFSVLYWSP